MRLGFRLEMLSLIVLDYMVVHGERETRPRILRATSIWACEEICFSASPSRGYKTMVLLIQPDDNAHRKNLALVNGCPTRSPWLASEMLGLPIT